MGIDPAERLLLTTDAYVRGPRATEIDTGAEAWRRRCGTLPDPDEAPLAAA
jgi:hypothetical protein